MGYVLDVNPSQVVSDPEPTTATGTSKLSPSPLPCSGNVPPDTHRCVGCCSIEKLGDKSDITAPSVWVLPALFFGEFSLSLEAKRRVATEGNCCRYSCHLSNGGQSQAPHKGVLVTSRERKTKCILHFILGRSLQATLLPYIPCCLVALSERQRKAEHSAETHHGEETAAALAHSTN